MKSTDVKSNKPFSLYILFLLLGSIAIGGLYGGAMLIYDPTGRSMGMRIEDIAHAGFINYLIPGILLFICNGLMPAFSFFALLKKPGWDFMISLNAYKYLPWPVSFSLYSGFILVSWIFIQIFLMGYQNSYQPVYGLLGLAVIKISLLPSLREYYSKK